LLETSRLIVTDRPNRGNFRFADNPWEIYSNRDAKWITSIEKALIKI
jgi:hypothetical protein